METKNKSDMKIAKGTRIREKFPWLPATASAVSIILPAYKLYKSEITTVDNEKKVNPIRLEGAFI